MMSRNMPGRCHFLTELLMLHKLIRSNDGPTDPLRAVKIKRGCQLVQVSQNDDRLNEGNIQLKTSKRSSSLPCFYSFSNGVL
jgi:hypothetical protein